MDNLLDHYGWWLLALVLIAAEILAPGYFMLWIGIAAGLMGVLTLVVPSLSLIAQAIVFALLAPTACFVYWKFIRPHVEVRDDQPLLNQRGQRMVGRRVIVCEAIVNGRGKVKVGDGQWLAEGPDTSAQTEVEVVAINGTTLRVKACL
ncbi:MAG: NfeD family protein [Rhodanobacter sp.]|jgi:membrane protein implicated in regulation of membrane protease activity|nr:NfeD family protein [Rhodanobacter sp.]